MRPIAGPLTVSLNDVTANAATLDLVVPRAHDLGEAVLVEIITVGQLTVSQN